jgi:type II secretory pathway pseudopilin PulG
MRFIANKRKPKIARAAFTLMEVLAALIFMAIVIPVALQALRVASLAGEVGERKKAAARIGQSVLDEMRASSQSQNAITSGQVKQGSRNYSWTINTETWPEDAMRLATVDVAFVVQGKNYDVRLSTLLPPQ